MQVFLVLSVLTLAAGAPGDDPASLEKVIAEAPGPVGCELAPVGKADPACELRQRGLSAAIRLYELDRLRALAVVKKRLEEIPSARGGYFPILVAARLKDKELLPSLYRVADAQRENDLGAWAEEAARLISTGKCSQVPEVPKLAELCK